MAAHKMLIAQVLKNLGHPVPTEDQLDSALKAAFRDVKIKDGVDPNTVKYKLSLVPVTESWVKDTFR